MAEESDLVRELKLYERMLTARMNEYKEQKESENPTIRQRAGDKLEELLHARETLYQLFPRIFNP